MDLFEYADAKKKTKVHRDKTMDDPQQSRLFIEKAREIGADEKSRADELIGKLAKKPPEPRKKNE